MGKVRNGRESQPSGGGVQLPAVAWAVPEPAEEAGQPAEAAAGPARRAPAAVGAAGAMPPVGESGAAAPGQSRAGVSAVPAPAGAAEEEGGQRRLPKSMVAAAVIAGLVLVGVPLALSGFGGDGPHPPGADGPPPAGYSQPDGGGDGYVPGPDAPGNPPGNPPGDQPPQPGPPADGPAPGEGVVPAAAGAAALPDAVQAPDPGPSARPTGRPATGTAASAPAPAQGAGQSTAQTNGQAAGTPQPQPPAAEQPAVPPAKPTQQAAPPPPPPPPTYYAVAGPGCGGSTSMQLNGWYDKGQEGWRRNSGGYTGDGCGGGFSSVPMSGDANDDKSNSVVWTFTTGPVTTGTCNLSVFVPDGDIKAVGGAPTYYTVQDRSFEVNQVAHRGQWVSAGTFPLSGGRIAVVLHSRGNDWKGGTQTYAHHAASAVRANCTG